MKPHFLFCRPLGREGPRMQSQSSPAPTSTTIRPLRWSAFSSDNLFFSFFVTCKLNCGTEAVWCNIVFWWLCLRVQGFICPQCMKSHNSAEELFKHYELFHDTGDLPAHVAPTRWDLFWHVWPDCAFWLMLLFRALEWNTLFPPFREDLTMLRQEVQDLHASLKVQFLICVGVWFFMQRLDCASVLFYPD